MPLRTTDNRRRTTSVRCPVSVKTTCSRDDHPGDRPAARSRRTPRRSRGVASPPFFAGLVTFAQRQDPIPSRTRPSNAEAPMVLCLKTWESRSLPGLRRTDRRRTADHGYHRGPRISDDGRDDTLPSPTPAPSLDTHQSRRDAGTHQPRRNAGTHHRRGVEQPGSSSGS